MSTKTTKCSKTNKESVKKSREDQRHALKLEKLTNMHKIVDSKVDELIEEVKSEKFKNIPEIDRHIYLLLVSSLETYCTALGLKIAWESVRIRTSKGAHLNNDFLSFWDFIFGKPSKGKAKHCNKPGTKCKKTK